MAGVNDDDDVVQDEEDDELDDMFSEDELDAEEDSASDDDSEEDEDDSDDSEDSDDSTADEEDSTAEDADTTESESGKTVPMAAVLDERRKRQEAERELAELRKNAPKDDDESDPEPDMFEHPEEWKAWNTRRVERAAEEKAYNENVEFINNSRSAMLTEKDDYLEKERIFYRLADGNLDLIQEMQMSGDPARFAYEKAVEWQDKQDAAQEARIIEKLKAQGRYVEKDEDAGGSKTGDTGKKASKSKTPSLATATAASKNGVHKEQEEDLMDMFEDQKY